jgi:single-strand DNA-binding protein
MGKSVNKVILLGHAGKDPEVHELRSGTVVNLSLATNESFKDNRGEWQERTEWHHLVGYQRVAEIIRGYVRKGSRIYIEGALRTRCWDDKEAGQTRYRTEIVVFEVSLLSPAHTSEGETGSSAYRNGNGFVPDGQYAESEITRQEVPY